MKIKTIDVNAKEWFRVSAGNCYLAVKVTINYGMKDQKTLVSRVQNGYDDYYKQIAQELIAKAFPRQKEWADSRNSLWHIVQDKKIITRYNIQRGCKEREVKAFANN
jgi:hypothetical protein